MKEFEEMTFQKSSSCRNVCFDGCVGLPQTTENAARKLELRLFNMMNDQSNQFEKNLATLRNACRRVL